MLLGHFTAEEFLADYWQQKPLLIRNAIPEFVDPLTADELAGLAMEECVESRLINSEARTGEYELSHGPFASDELQALGAQNSTLLVQAVDHWIEAVAALRAQCSFLPQWRMDDVMVSFATPGGGVGPHFDQYDVFLLQGQGSRLWRVGPACDANTPQIDNGGLRNITPFTPLQQHLLHGGDVLYVPPGVAHWGIAQTDCLTYSFGFRAPSHAEVLSEWSDSVAATLSEKLRYTDPPLAAANGSSLIDPHVIDRLQYILRHYADDRDALATWFGSWVTEAKYPELAPEREFFDAEKLQRLLGDHTHLQRRLATRVAISRLKKSCMLFVDGEAIAIPDSSLPLAQLLSKHCEIATHILRPLCEDSDNCHLLTKLLTSGSFALTVSN